MRWYQCNVGNDGVLRYYIKVFVFLKPFERIRLTLSTFVNNVCLCTIKSFTYTYYTQTIELPIHPCYRNNVVALTKNKSILVLIYI